MTDASAAAGSWDEGARRRPRRGLLIGAAVVVVVAGLGAVTAVALSGRQATFPTGSGTATITWQTVRASGSATSSPQPFSGTIAGVPISGVSTTPTPRSFAQPGSNPTIPSQLTLARWTGTFASKTFSVAVSADLSKLASGLTGPGFTVKVDGTYGTEPVHATASFSATPDELTFAGTVGHHHITGSVHPTENGAANTAAASFVVTG
jgi:hypothetical protein